MAGIRNHEDLIAWQLCEDLKERIFAFTDQSPACKDFEFCAQIRSAANSATDNLAEGFYRYHTRDFARFCSFSRSSLGEIKSQLRHARKHRYLEESHYQDILKSSRRAMAATTNLQTYLRKAPPR